MCDIEVSDRPAWTVDDVAALSGASRAFIYELVERGEVPSIRIGRRILIPRSAIAGMIEAAGGCTCGQ